MTIRTVSANVRHLFGGAPTAAAVADLSPSMLSNLMVSLEAVSPGVSTELLRSSSGALRRVPGMHNDVFSEMRENSNPASSKINGGKSDPRAVTRIQLASALCERDLVESGAIVDPLEAAAEIDRIETRIDAIASGAIAAPPPGTSFDELPEKTRKFYQRHTIDEVGALTAVSQRMSDKLFEDVTEQARVAAAPRPISPLAEQLAAAHDEPLSVASFVTAVTAAGANPANGVEIAEGAKLVVAESGAAYVLVDGLRLPVDRDSRISDLVGRIPAVDFDQFTHVPVGDNSSGLNVVVQSMMVGKSPRAQSMRLAARRHIIERTFYGDTPMGYAAGSDGRVHQLTGKARAHTAAMLASRPHSSRHGADAEATTTRIEGFDLSRHLRFSRAARQQFLATQIPDTLLVKRAPETKLKRYSGPVPAEDRDAAARAGFRVRHRNNTLDTDYPGAAARLNIDWDSTAAVAEAVPGKALSPEHADVRATGVKLVTAANRITRQGRNPELAGAEALVAEAKLTAAFELYRVAKARDHSPRVLTATQVVPSAYRRREAEFVRDVFPTGGSFTTQGYTLARSDGASHRGAGRVRVRYLTSDAMPIAGGDVVDTGTTFRVVSAQVAADGTVEVDAVADQVAARAAGTRP